MRQINEIIIHCTATRPNWWADKSSQQKVDEVRRGHVEDNKWSDNGYHALIDRDGTTISGRPIERAGAHTKGHNSNSIGIALFGGHGGAATDNFLDNFTPDQEAALKRLIEHYQSVYPGINKISGHNQYANKACPTFSVPAWLDGARNIRQAPAIAASNPGRTSVSQSRTVQASAVQVVSAVGGGVAAVGALDGVAQIVAIVGCFVIAGLALFIMKERVRKWADGVR